MQIITDRRQRYIKGYKLDAREPDDPEEEWEPTWYEAIIDSIPRSVYIKIDAGVEPNGHIVLVIVLDQGYNRRLLEENPIHAEDEVLALAAKHFLTPSIWPSLWS